MNTSNQNFNELLLKMMSSMLLFNFIYARTRDENKLSKLLYKLKNIHTSDSYIVIDTFCSIFHLMHSRLCHLLLAINVVIVSIVIFPIVQNRLKKVKPVVESMINFFLYHIYYNNNPSILFEIQWKEEKKKTTNYFNWIYEYFIKTSMCLL